MAAIAVAAASSWAGTATVAALAEYGALAYVGGALASVAVSSIGRSAFGLDKSAAVVSAPRAFAGQVAGRPTSFGQPQQVVQNNDFGAAATGQTAMIRSAVAPRRVVYGRAMLSGPVVYACSSPGSQSRTYPVLGTAAVTGKRTTLYPALAGATTLELVAQSDYGVKYPAIPIGTVFHFFGDNTDYKVETFKESTYAVSPVYSQARTVGTIMKTGSDGRSIYVQAGAQTLATVAGEKVIIDFGGGKNKTANIIGVTETNNTEAATSYTLTLETPLTLTAGRRITTSLFGGGVAVTAVTSATQIDVEASSAAAALTAGTVIYPDNTEWTESGPVYDQTSFYSQSSKILSVAANYPPGATDQHYMRLDLDSSIIPDGYSDVTPYTEIYIMAKDSGFTGSLPKQTITFSPQLQNGVGQGFELDISVTVVAATPSTQQTTARVVQHQYLHLVIPLCEGEVEAIEQVYLDGKPWREHGHAEVAYHTGQPDQAADAALIAASGGTWTSAHRLQGITYIYVRLNWEPSAYPNGIPNIKALVKGKKVLDPRHPENPPAWSENWALCLRDYLMSDYGLNCPPGEIDDAHFIAAADIADEAIPVAGGTQPRYTCNGAIDLTAKPQDIIDQMIAAGAGMLTYTQGKFALFAGKHVAGQSVLTLTESDLRGPISVNPKLPRRDMFNGVRGQFIDSTAQWQLSDFPTYKNATYAAADGEVIIKDIQLPYVNDPVRAQRLAKIILERGRNATSVSYPAKLIGLQVAVGDTVALNIAQLGYVGKEFLVVGWTFSQDGGVDLSLVEISAAVYDWAMGEATTVDLTPPTRLPSRWLLPPVGLRLGETLKRENNNYVTVTTIDFGPSQDARAAGYEIQAAVIVDDNPVQDFVPLANGPATHYEYRHVEPCRVAVRVRAVSSRGSHSPWADEQIVVHGPEGYISAIGLPDPVNPSIGITQDAEGHVTRVQFQGGYQQGDIVPDGVVVYFSITDHLNAFQVASGGTGSTLQMSSAEVIAASNVPPGAPLTVKAGSTTNALVITDAVHPMPPYENIYGMVWMQTGAGKWRKATRNDATTVYFEDEPFDVAPVVGAAINWTEIAWVDNREPQHRFGYIEDGAGGYEVIRWGEVTQDGAGFYLDGCLRGAEGTTPISADGKTFYFFPAAMKGSEAIVFPTASFSQTAPGVFEAKADKEITWKRNQYVSASCCTFVKVGEKFVRSRLVPLALWGKM